MANHGDKNQYDRYMRSLEPQHQFDSQPASLPSTEGIVYVKE